MVTFQLLMVLAAGLFSTGLFGALSQQSIVMIMMGIELMIGGVIVAAADFWHYLAPSQGSGQVVVVAAVVSMAVEMGIGFAVTTAIYRTRQDAMTDMAEELKG
jgi:NAD(P)H-quinone oxidoreductase subunit 4L